MSTEAEKAARREAELMDDPDKVSVRVRVAWDGSLCVPCPDGDAEEEAVFKVMTLGDNLVSENACRFERDEDGHKTFGVDYNEMRRMSLKRGLLSWSLDVPIERRNGWLTPECYARVGRVFGPLLEAFLDEYWRTSEVDDDEEQRMSRQASVLFGKNSRGVTDACEAVRLYCTMGSFSEKFGLDRKSLLELPFREYLMLKIMIGHENEAMRRQSKPKNMPQTRIAGKGGRTRPSRGQRIPL